MNLQDFLLSINGCGTLVASDGTFLGVVSSNPYELNSICHPNGQYGSPHALYSVRNQHGMYGGLHGIYSPYNPHCLQPPVIVCNGRVVLIVTRNTNLTAIGFSSSAFGWIQGVPLVDPDLLFAVYDCLDSTTTTSQFSGGFSPVTSEQSLSIDDYVAGCNNYGLELHNSQRYEEAIASFEEAIAINPLDPEVWNNKGNTLDKLQRYEEAIACYDQAIHLQPHLVIAWYNRGHALLNLQRYEDAAASLDRVIQLKPNIAEVWLLRGSALGELKRFAEALICCDRGIQLNPELPEGWVIRGIVLAKLQQHEKAIATCDKAIQIKPDHPIGWYGKACCYALQGNVELTIKNLQGSIELNSQYRETAKVDSCFEDMREHQRFQQLINQ